MPRKKLLDKRPIAPDPKVQFGFGGKVHQWLDGGWEKDRREAPFLRCHGDH